MYRNHYDVLGVRRDASQDEIKQAYRRLIKQYHPDRLEVERAQAQTQLDRHIAERQIRDAHQQTQIINQAYATLSNAAKRQSYDATLTPVRQTPARPYTPPTRPAPGRPPPRPQRPPAENHGPDPDELIRRIGFSLFVLIALLFACELTVNGMFPPDDPPASVISQSQRNVEATAHALRIPAQPRSTTEAVMLESIAAINAQDYESAINDLTWALMTAPTADLYYLRGMAFSRQARGVSDPNNGRAISDFTDAIAQQPSFAEAYYERGTIYYNSWRIFGDEAARQGAKADFEQYLQLTDAEDTVRLQLIIERLDAAAP